MADLQRLEVERDDAFRRAPTRTAAPDLGTPDHDVAGGTDAAAIARLQQAAGNAGVAALLSGQESSPVAGVIGRGGGEPLDRATRADMESSFGTDFSGVRVHRGSDASASAHALGARAYTVGSDVVLADGADDRHTLAHELSHVVQQGAGPVDGHDAGDGLQVSDPGDRFEQAAEATADAVVSGGHASTPAPSHTVPTAQRDAEGSSSPEDDAAEEGEEVRSGTTEVQRASGQAGDDDDSDAGQDVSAGQELSAGQDVGSGQGSGEAIGSADTGGGSGAGLQSTGESGDVTQQTGGDTGDATQLTGGGAGNSYTKVNAPKNTTYTVTGTLSEAADTMVARGEAGHVQPGTPQVNTDADANGKTTAARIVIDETLEMPTWSTKSTRPQAEQAEWDRFYAALQTHENGHLSRDQSGYAGTHLKLIGQDDSKAGDLVDKVTTTVDADNATYDSTTHHGETQGTKITIP